VTIIDNAVYVDGIRAVEPRNLEQTFETLTEHGGMAWIGLYRPTPEEMAAVAAEFGLHGLAVEDAISAHQRPKLERYDDNLFTVLRPARYLDETETVEFGELHVFTGRNFVVTVRHAETGVVGQVRRRMERRPDLLCHGPEAVLYALMDQVVDDYGPVVAGLENDIDEIEDHVERLISRADSFRDLLQNALTLDGTLTANRQNEASAEQNEQVKKISSWAAIFFAPTFVAGLYGMNFDVMPELHWTLGYPMAIGLMVGTAALMFAIFKKKGWL
jgi:magnesium transporter